jgi:hypothetical protein
MIDGNHDFGFDHRTNNLYRKTNLRLKVAGEKLAHVTIARISGFTDAEVIDVVISVKPIQEIVTELSTGM